MNFLNIEQATNGISSNYSTDNAIDFLDHALLFIEKSLNFCQKVNKEEDLNKEGLAHLCDGLNIIIEELAPIVVKSQDSFLKSNFKSLAREMLFLFKGFLQNHAQQQSAIVKELIHHELFYNLTQWKIKVIHPLKRNILL